MQATEPYLKVLLNRRQSLLFSVLCVWLRARILLLCLQKFEFRFNSCRGPTTFSAIQTIKRRFLFLDCDRYPLFFGHLVSLSRFLSHFFEADP